MTSKSRVRRPDSSFFRFFHFWNFWKVRKKLDFGVFFRGLFYGHFSAFFDFYRKLEVLQLCSCICLVGLGNSLFDHDLSEALCKKTPKWPPKNSPKPSKTLKIIKSLKSTKSMFWGTAQTRDFGVDFWRFFGGVFGGFLEGFLRFWRYFQIWEFSRVRVDNCIWWVQGHLEFRRSLGFSIWHDSEAAERTAQSHFKTWPKSTSKNLEKTSKISCYSCTSRWTNTAVLMFWW